MCTQARGRSWPGLVCAVAQRREPLGGRASARRTGGASDRVERPVRRRRARCSVGKAGFEPAASTSRTWRAAKLRYFPLHAAWATCGATVVRPPPGRSRRLGRGDAGAAPAHHRGDHRGRRGPPLGLSGPRSPRWRGSSWWRRPGGDGPRRCRRRAGPGWPGGGDRVERLDEVASAPDWPARNTSAVRSSSSRTGTWGRRPPDSSRRRSIVTAMPPIVPTWKSHTRRSGRRSATAARTGAPGAQDLMGDVVTREGVCAPRRGSRWRRWR